MLDNIDLVKEDERVEDRESGIVKDSGKYNVFEILQAIRRVDLAFYRLVFNLDHLLEFGFVRKVLSVICLVQREVWVVCESQ